ncbi:hypothetical protein [Candidatus Marimicrobium litorale]|uniref:Lipocalin-like domain-containing protein n=1 Tax=Candidatus Marimicrobium litorale TaxID=2518991 RepID=A0ABT3TAA6_9GAMM|nr:hypothetical protein [Candidatus Marimicrobium litorale]MCX2979236.1 hypothetical protein [Candidatus Marimicrobium litorale]
MGIFRKISFLSAATIIIATMGVPMNAEQQAPDPIDGLPDLRGNWVGTYKVYLHGGHKMAEAEFRIVEQDGPYFRGKNAWRHVDKKQPMTTKIGKLISQDEEPFVGVIGFNNTSISIAEQDDMGALGGQLVNRDTMQLIYSEPGANAMVFRIELKRKR